MPYVLTWTAPLNPKHPARSGLASSGGTPCLPSNLTGHPAVTIPVQMLPVPAGLQLIGRRGGDEALLGLATRLEELLSALNVKGVEA